jgi:hypothetical protein
VKSSDIYWGAVPWVVLQLILVLIIILWPQSVTYWIDRPKAAATPTTIEMPLDLPPPPPADFDAPLGR